MAYDNFAEGDSGVVMSPAIAEWNRLQADSKNNSHPDFKTFADVQIYIVRKSLVIATSEKTKAADAVAAFEVARKALADYLKITGQA